MFKVQVCKLDVLKVQSAYARLGAAPLHRAGLHVDRAGGVHPAALGVGLGARGEQVGAVSHAARRHRQMALIEDAAPPLRKPVGNRQPVQVDLKTRQRAVANAGRQAVNWAVVGGGG